MRVEKFGRKFIYAAASLVLALLVISGAVSPRAEEYSALTEEAYEAESAVENTAELAETAEPEMMVGDPSEEELTGEESTVEEVLQETSEEETEEIISGGESFLEEAGLDNDSLFEEYARRCFGMGASGSARKKAARVAVDSLNSRERVIYNALMPVLKEIAAGNRTSTVISIPMEDIIGEDWRKRRFTAEELGIEYIYDPESQTYAETEIIKNAIFNLRKIHRAIILDCPWDLYWFDRVVSLSTPYLVRSKAGLAGYKDTNGTNTIEAVTFRYNVEYKYRVLPDESTEWTEDETAAEAGKSVYETDPARTGAAARAAETAAGIIAEAAGDPDFDKLFFYTRKICDLVRYDYTSSGNGNAMIDRGAWSLIYVFDGDPDTNVVCEGYAEAFQYLCDMTKFRHSGIRCISVLGNTTAFHKWNVVRMDDGLNYIVDITNCDIYGDRRLFLAGAAGSVESGYTVYWGPGITGADGQSIAKSGKITYRYTSETTDVMSEDLLSIASDYYRVPAPIVPSVSYRVICKGDADWRGTVSDGETAGTTGQALLMEAVSLTLIDRTTGGKTDPARLGIEYSGHIQNKGWSTWVSAGGECGFPGWGLRIEGLKVRLTGSEAEDYDIWYCLHAQNYGWLGWAKNGEESGTEGMALRVEAISVKILPKGSERPALLGTRTQTFYKSPTIFYSSYVEKQGWQKEVRKNTVSGTSGQSLRLEAFKLRVSGETDLGVEYQSHIQNKGWEKNWTKDGNQSGMPGSGRRMEALRIRLTGSDAEKYDIWYCLHVQNYGWLGWAKNGASAGTEGRALRVEALCIRILPKGSPVPKNFGSRTQAFIK